jgi:hypothetical protein
MRTLAIGVISALSLSTVGVWYWARWRRTNYSQRPPVLTHEANEPLQEFYEIGRKLGR